MWKAREKKVDTSRGSWVSIEIVSEEQAELDGPLALVFCPLRGGVQDVDFARGIANKMAAAPELLEALEPFNEGNVADLTEPCDDWPTLDDVPDDETVWMVVPLGAIRKAQAVIAKARREEASKP
jgi:hypothetical protein